MTPVCSFTTSLSSEGRESWWLSCRVKVNPCSEEMNKNYRVNLKKVPRKHVTPNHHVNYIWHTLQKNIFIIIFSHPWGCETSQGLLSVSSLFLGWHQASKSSDVSKMLQKCSEQGKADPMSYSKSGIKCWFNTFKSSGMSWSAVFISCCAGAQKPEVHTRNQMRPSRLHWSENLKHTIPVTSELELHTAAWEKNNPVFSKVVGSPARYNQLFHAVPNSCPAALMDGNALCIFFFKSNKV